MILSRKFPFIHTEFLPLLLSFSYLIISGRGIFSAGTKCLLWWTLLLLLQIIAKHSAVWTANKTVRGSNAEGTEINDQIKIPLGVVIAKKMKTVRDFQK